MTSRVRVAHEEFVAAPAAAVWPYFDWPNLERMQPGGFFLDIRYDERRSIPGATRSIRLGGANGNGARLNEMLEHCDPQAMQMHYRVIDPAPMPIADYRGEVSVRVVDATHCVVRFACEATLQGIDEQAWRETYRAMQRDSVDFIRRQVTDPAPPAAQTTPSSR